nr:RNA-directed DNA polymerase, eukaryota [Tanacetum cinerariifolium]
ETLDPSPSLSHPPGFSPVGSVKSRDKEQVMEENTIQQNKEFSPSISAKVMNNSQVVQDDVLYNSGGGVLGNKAKKEWVNELTNNNKLNFIAIQETKMEKVSHMDVKFMWGNSNYDYVFSESVRNSGGILCIWDESIFRKYYVTISNSFVAIYEKRIPNKTKILIVSIYAPQQPSLRRLQELKKVIRLWINVKKSQLVGSKNSIVLDLRDIDKQLDQIGPNDLLIFRHHELKCNLNDLKEMEAMDSFQKSKVRWAIEGDENLKYFHGIINKKRSHLAIRAVFNDDIWRTDPSSVKKAFRDHYEARFNKPTMTRLKLSFPFLKRLSIDQDDDLERGVSHDEIRSAVWDCGENKSPGPDGFTFEFFKKYWRFIGLDFCEAVEHFFSRSVYKVVTKILANRLATVIAGLVSDTQSAFFVDRQILDGPFILNEVLDWCKRKNKQAMFFKVDFAKAYDSVRWDFLIDVLEAFGFGSTWCNWIRGTFCYAKASILVNGSPFDEFHLHCGLKQGDPLSPYLFILVMESLHLSVSRAVDESVFKGIQLHGSLSLSHLFFANDTLFMGEWSDSNLRGCSIMEKKFRYLGVMVGERMSRYKTWDDVVLKLKTRLSKWKAKTLSIGGRLNLLKSVLGASPLYNMSIFKVPKGVLKASDRWYCSLSSSGEFCVKEARIAIDDMALHSHPEHTRWVKFIPIKINIFVWRARRDCLLTRHNLVHKGVVLESTTCPVCLSGVEDVHHILFRCSLAQEVLHRVCRWWEMDFQHLTLFSEWEVWFSSIRLPVIVKSLMEGVFYVTWWFIWGFRNRSIFDDNTPSRSKLFDDIVSSSFLWYNSRCSRKFSWDAWLKTSYLISL